MTEEAKTRLKIKKLIQFLKGNKCLQKSKESRNNLLESAKTLRQCACEVGLSQEEVFDVCDLASCGKFGDVVCNNLLRSAIPRESVPDDAILLLLSNLCQDLQSIKVKNLIIRWMVLVFDLIALKNSFHALYGVIFHYIESEVLCPAVCQLLSLLTRKCDVTHNRILRLLALQRKIGSKPYLCGLLSVYRMYQPSLISMAGKHMVFFKKPDKAWGLTITRVQQRYGLHMMSETMAYNTSHLPEPTKSQALITHPKLTMAHDESPLSQIISGKVPIYRIKSFKELLSNFSNLEMTTQSHALLSSTTLQHLLAVTNDRTMAVRLSFWLHHRLCEELVTVVGETDRGRELIKTVVKFSGFIQECLPVCEAFLFRYLCTWNGSDYLPYISKLIGKLRLLPFTVLHNFVLSPLEKLFQLSTSIFFKCTVIIIMEELLGNYLSLESHRYDVIIDMQENNAPLEKLANYMVQPYKVGKIDANEVIMELIRFVDRISLLGAISTNNDPIFLYMVLHFYNKTSGIYSDHKRAVFTLPPKAIVSLSLFSLSSMLVENVFGVLLKHLKCVKSLNKSEQRTHYAHISTLNRYLTDVHNTLWRWKAFQPNCGPDTMLYDNLHVDCVGQLLSHSVAIPANRMFSVERHPAFVQLTTEFLQISDIDSAAAFDAKFVNEDAYMEYIESSGLTRVCALIQFLRGGITSV